LRNQSCKIADSQWQVANGEQGLKTVQAIRYSPFVVRSLLHTLSGH